jgi:hypothetical protein
MGLDGNNKAWRAGHLEIPLQGTWSQLQNATVMAALASELVFGDATDNTLGFAADVATIGLVNSQLVITVDIGAYGERSRLLRIAYHAVAHGDVAL